MFTKEVIDLTPQVIETLKKLGWEGWEKPETGEWCIWEGETHLVLKFMPEKEIDNLIIYVQSNRVGVDMKGVIPILHWEKIEEILEELGYRADLQKQYITWKDFEFYCSLRRVGKGGYHFILSGPVCKTRQLAVMKAVVKLIKGVG